MTNRKLSLLRVVLIAFLLEWPIIVSFIWMTGDFSTQRFNVWPISEWLINYQGGFVRRGLVGQLLLIFYGQASLIKPVYLLVFWSFVAYIVCFLGVYWKAGVRNANMLIAGLVIQGGIFHMGISSDFYTRKENLFLVFFAILCLLYLQIGNAATSRSKSIWVAVFIACLLIVSPALMLIHEGYIFMSFPATFILLWILYQENPTQKYLRVAMIMFPLEALFFFLVCAHFHGNIFLSQAIWDSLPFADRLFLSPPAPYSSFGAIASIGWGFDQQLTTLYGVFSSGGIWAWLFFMLGNGFILVYIIAVIAPTSKGGQISQYTRWVLYAILLSSGMFFLASDWGRWLAFLSNQSILLIFALSASTVLRTQETSDIFLSIHKYFKRLSSPCSLGFLLLYGLSFQMPECCIAFPEIFPPYAAYLKYLIGLF